MNETRGKNTSDTQRNKDLNDIAHFCQKLYKPENNEILGWPKCSFSQNKRHIFHFHQ